jgi:hypothetical protein
MKEDDRRPSKNEGWGASSLPSPRINIQQSAISLIWPALLWLAALADD